jgi:hypothetical protein
LRVVRKILATTSSEVEADLLEARLRGAGIRCMRSAGAARGGRLSSGREVLVEEEDIDRAREVLGEADGGFDEEELARLSEEADRRSDKESATIATPAPGGHYANQSVDPHAPRGRRGLRGAIKALAKPGHGEGASDNPFGR